MSMLIRISWSASAVAAALALTSVLGGTAPAGTLRPYSHPIQGLAFLSNPEYTLFRHYMGRELARRVPFTEAVSMSVRQAKGGETERISALQAEQRDPWFIISDQKDKVGLDMPVRRGIRGTGPNFKGGFGYEKYSEKHNVTSIRLVHAAITQGSKAQLPGRAGPNYEGHVVGQAQDGVYIDEKIVVGTDAGHYVYALKQNSPDGKPVGVVTAFCQNKVKCPNEVNDLGSG